MSRWIFQDIQDLQEAMYREARETGKSIVEEPLQHFNEKVREKIDPKIFTWWLMWKCDIYVYVAQIIFEVSDIYPDVSKKQVNEWVVGNMEEHHQLIYPKQWWHKLENGYYQLCIPE